MKPSPILASRLKTRVPITTKRVGRGFYRGTNTGAMGAHTKFGGYIIDWRSVRHFVVPEAIKDGSFKLTPYVSNEIHAEARLPEDRNGEVYEPREIDGLHWLKQWKNSSPQEYAFYVEEKLRFENVTPEKKTT